MNSREEVYRLVWTLFGAIVGIGVGLSLMWMLFDKVPYLSASVGVVPLLVVLCLCGGGLIGGGYLALYIVSRRQRAVRRRYFDERRKKRKKGKK